MIQNVSPVLLSGLKTGVMGKRFEPNDTGVESRNRALVKAVQL